MSISIFDHVASHPLTFTYQDQAILKNKHDHVIQVDDCIFHSFFKIKRNGFYLELTYPGIHSDHFKCMMSNSSHCKCKRKANLYTFDKEGVLEHSTLFGYKYNSKDGEYCNVDWKLQKSYYI